MHCFKVIPAALLWRQVSNTSPLMTCGLDIAEKGEKIEINDQAQFALSYYAINLCFDL